MGKISDELRKWCDANFWEESGDYLRTLADRIDSEMVELPRDGDGVPIHVGDTAWNDEGYKLRVVSITSYGDTYRVYAVCPGCDSYVGPEDLTRNRPDSFEHIADELDEMVNAASHADDTCERLADLADRIRRLAKED